MGQRSKWGTNRGFLLAAIGSAVGLGNIWRFPYVAYENGGGAFLLPYFVALLTAGIPILMLEFALGHQHEASAPKVFRMIDPKWEWLGWWSVIFVMFGIELYYIVIIGWCGNYMVFSAFESWKEMGPDAFFFEEFLGRSEASEDGSVSAVWNIGTMRWRIVIAVAIVWFVNWTITYRGVQKGIEKAVMIMMPILLVITVLITVWALFLEGAKVGIEHYVTPDFSRITDLKVWIAAYGQIFFSLSLGFGIMIAYSSYLPRDANIFKNSLIVGFSNSFYEVFVGFGVFSILGYMATQKGVGLDEVVTQSLGLAFVTYPTAISQMPFGQLFGVIFFFLLVIAGISSSISIIQAFTAAVMDKFSISRKKIITTICLVGFCGSLLFTTNSGLFWIDIVDHFLNHYGLITVGIIEALIVGWLYRTDRLKSHIVTNLWLSGKGHNLFKYVILQLVIHCVRFSTPVVLALAIVNSLIQELRTPYEGYPISGILILGVGWVLVTHLFAFGVSGLPWQKTPESES